jgi:hypothetical protein
MSLVPFHLGWRGPQNRRAGFESRKEPRELVERSQTRTCEPDILVGPEQPGPWLTAEQNLLLAVRHAAGGAPRTDTESIVDGRTGCRMIEIFAAILPVGWG